LLRVLDIQGSLKEQQESSMRKVTEVVQTISKPLKDYDYAFFKLVKSLSYVPADIDILVDAGQVGRVVHEIVGLGYNIVVKDPYCITLTRGDSIIDLYVHPSLGGVIFIDCQKLLEHRCLMEFNGVEIVSLESLLSHELVARGFRIVGLDIRDYPFKNKRVYLLREMYLTQGCLMNV
jgi:hypothetical protein